MRLSNLEHTLFNFTVLKVSEETTNRMNRLSQAESENEVG